MRLNLLAVSILLLSLLSQESAVVTTTTISGLSPAALDVNKIQIITDGISTTDCSVGGGSFTVFCRSNGSAWVALGAVTGNGGGVPSGAILIINSGSCPAGYTEVASFNGKTLIGTLAANGDVGSTGGSDTVTPAGVNSGGAVDAHSGATVADHSSHTHSYSDVINHSHAINITDPGHGHIQRQFPTATGSSIGNTIDTSMSGTQANQTLLTASATTGITASSLNPVGGVAQGTTSGPNAVLTHSVTQPANHIFTQPIFTGAQMDNRSAWVKCVFCKKD